MKLKNKVIIITGASSGIGASLALRCALKKARLVLAARSAKPLEEIALKVRAAGAEAMAVPTDVTDAAAVRHLVAQATERFGPIDVLVNSAGYGIFAPIQKAKVSDLEGMLRTNVIGAANCIEVVLPQMLARRKGQIVNVASAAGQGPLGNCGYYATSKYALVGMSKVMRIDLAGSGVRVATICPGIIETAFYEQADKALFSFWARFPGELTAIDVATAMEQAITSRLNGEKILPFRAFLLARLAHFFPATAEFLSKVIR
jgi:uncharacterized protein